MFNNRNIEIELEILYRLKIEKEMLGQIIIDLREYLPDFSSPTENLYFFINKALGYALIISSKNIILRCPEGIDEAVIQNILLSISKFIPNKKQKIKIRLKRLIEKDGQVVDYRSEIHKVFGEQEIKLKSVGFELEEKEATIFIGFQTRKDNLEGLLNIIVTLKESFIIDQNIYKLMVEYLDKVNTTVNRHISGLIL